jgi:aspartyl/asparaginyl beta-hydroxylase (cupin superfamily)
MHRNSDAQWVKMNFDIPCYDIEQEYLSVKEELVINRPQDGHKDWFAASLFIKDNITEVGLKCTKTVEFIKSLPYDRLDDVRFLVIKPEGYIAEHSDVPEHNWLDTLNMSISYPNGSKFILNGEEVPYHKGAAFVLNVHYSHWVENKSDEERLHLIIHGKKKKEFWNDIIEIRM